MGDFGNEYVSNIYILVPLVLGTLIGLPVFGHFYNKLMDSLKGTEHTSVYVTGGVLVTILVGALFSWKAALLFLILFGLDGSFMIVGDYRRGLRKEKNPRRRRMPYVANSLLEDAWSSASMIHKLMGVALDFNDLSTLGKMQHELTTVLLRLEELKGIQEK